MPRVLVIYDANEPPLEQTGPPPGVKTAALDLPAGIAGRDVYEVSRKLAELLLEQIEREEPSPPS